MLAEFTPLDFQPFHSFPAKDLLPIIAQPPGPPQLVATAYLLRSTLSHKDRKRFDYQSLDEVMDLVVDYMSYSRDYSEVLIEQQFYAENNRGTAN